MKKNVKGGSGVFKFSIFVDQINLLIDFLFD